MNGARMASFAYAASAPATILWGPAAHRYAPRLALSPLTLFCLGVLHSLSLRERLRGRRLGGSSMGGRTPSKTLLEAMSSSREAGA